jgi:hypothetical protein
MLNHCGQLDHGTTPLAFRTRVCLTALDAVAHLDNVNARPLARSMIDRVLEGEDGYAARDVLRAQSARGHLDARQAGDLTALVRTCGLESGALPARVHADLSTALDAGAKVLTAALAARPTRQRLP